MPLLAFRNKFRNQLVSDRVQPHVRKIADLPVLGREAASHIGVAAHGSLDQDAPDLHLHCVKR
ncbi:hypothetical protein D3C83_210790 [compost metagenome]